MGRLVGPVAPRQPRRVDVGDLEQLLVAPQARDDQRLVFFKVRQPSLPFVGRGGRGRAHRRLDQRQMARGNSVMTTVDANQPAAPRVIPIELFSQIQRRGE